VLLADILKARIQTVGVEEHPLKVEAAQGAYDAFACTKHPHCLLLLFSGIGGSLAWEHGQLWSIIDVGGSRALRGAWSGHR
jgi:hypothetical protein